MSDRSEPERITELLRAASERLGPVAAPSIETIADQARRRGVRRWWSRRSGAVAFDDFDDRAVTGVDSLPVAVETVPGHSPASRLGPLRFALAGAGLVALVMLSGLLVRGLQGDAAGAESPEGAVRGLAEAVSDEDALAAVRMLVPAEVRTLDGVVQAAADKAEAFEVARSAARPFTGLDVEVSDLQLTTEELAPGFVKVGLAGGQLSYETTPEELTGLVRRALGDSAAQRDAFDLGEIGCDGGDCSNRRVAPFLVAEEVDGRWYVSIAYSALERWRRDDGLPAADFGSARRLADSGASSPDDAVQGFTQALGDVDVERMLTLVDPDELGAFYDYREAIRATLDGGDAEPAFTVDSLETEVREHDGWAEVLLDSAGGTFAGSEEEGEPAEGAWTIDRGCLDVRDPWYPEEETRWGTCGRQANMPFLYPLPVDTTDLPIVVLERDGRWYVSPVGTVLGALSRSVEQVDRRWLYYLLGLPELFEPEGSLTFGVPAEGELRSWAEFEVWKFRGTEGQQVVVAYEVAGRDDDYLTVEIHGSDGEVIDYIEPGYPRVLPADDEYTLVVEGYAPDGYTLTLEESDSEVLPVGGEVRGRTEPNQPVFFALEGPSARVRVTAEIVSPAGFSFDLSASDVPYDYEEFDAFEDCILANPDDPELCGGLSPEPGAIVIDMPRAARAIVSVYIYPADGEDIAVPSGEPAGGEIEFVVRAEAVE